MNIKKYIKELSHLVSNNAISNNNKGLQKNIEFIKNRLISLDFKVHLIEEISGTPLIYAIKKNERSRKKIGIYSHYDVELTAKEKWNTIPTELKVIDERIFGRGVSDNLGIWLLRMQAIEDLNKNELPEIHWLFEGQEELGSPIAHEEFPKLDIPLINLWFEESGFFNLGTSRQRFLTLNEDIDLQKAKGIVTPLLSEYEFTSYTENRSLTKFDKCPFLNHVLKKQPYLAIGPNDEYSNVHKPNESLSLPLIEKSYEQFKELLKYYAE